MRDWAHSVNRPPVVLSDFDLVRFSAHHHSPSEEWAMVNERLAVLEALRPCRAPIFSLTTYLEAGISG
jgi:hypothetical protein